MSKSFTIAMKEFFGYRQGEGLTHFQQELKALSNEDRQYFYDGLKAQGIDCLPPATV